MKRTRICYTFTNHISVHFSIIFVESLFIKFLLIDFTIYIDAFFCDP